MSERPVRKPRTKRVRSASSGSADPKGSTTAPHGGAPGTPRASADDLSHLPTTFGRDGITGLVTWDEGVRLREVSQPTADDVALAEAVVGQLLARAQGPRR